MKKNEIKKVDTTAQAKLIQEVKNDETVKINLTDPQLLEMIIAKYKDVATKSAMLKLIRKDNFKVSQDRCYNMYLRYAKTIKEDKIEETK